MILLFLFYLCREGFEIWIYIYIKYKIYFKNLSIKINENLYIYIEIYLEKVGREFIRFGIRNIFLYVIKLREEDV